MTSLWKTGVAGSALILAFTTVAAHPAAADRGADLGAAVMAPGVAADAEAAGAQAAAFEAKKPTKKAKAAKAAKKKAKKKVKKKAKVVLGFHNFQIQNATQYLGRAGVPMHARFNCNVVMTSTTAELIQIRDTAEGQPAVIAGCGSGADMTKYKSGPMGPMQGSVGERDWSRYATWVAPGTSAAVPTVASYRAWLLQLKSVFGSKIDRFEVWNEVDLDNFYRGTPKDLVDLTFVAAEVFGRKKVTAPSWSPSAFSGAKYPSGAYIGGKTLSRKQFWDRYWQGVIKRAKKEGVPLPFSVVNIHTYGTGNTVKQAASNRMYKLKGFLGWLKKSLGTKLNKMEIWDTEWNFRRFDPDQKPPYLGFADSVANAKIWSKSAAEAACLGVSRQYTYVWADKAPDPSSFEAGQLPMNPTSANVNAAFRAMNGKTVTCK